MKRNPSASLCLMLATVATLALPVAAEEPWSFEVAPYLWVASVEAETSLPLLVPGPVPGEQKFDTRISGGFMLAAQAHYRSVGVYTDFNWLQLDTESVNSPFFSSGVSLRSDYIYTTAALSYTLPLRGKFHAEVMAGARLWNVASTFEFKGGLLPGLESNKSQTWVTPLVGANLRYDLTQHWLLLGHGTVGGFSDSSIQWDVFAGVGYQFTDWCLATLGYRYLHEDYTKDNFIFNADAQGFLLGVGFTF